MKYLVSSILSTVLIIVMVNCVGSQSKVTHFMVRGVDEETSGVEVLDPTEVCLIIDLHADSGSLRPFTMALSADRGDEGFRTAQSKLIKEIPSQMNFHRSLSSRGSVYSQMRMASFLPLKLIQEARRIDLDCLALNTRYVIDLPLLERVLNTPGYVEDKYESLRRAVMHDTELLASKGKNIREARLWLCVSSRSASNLSMIFTSSLNGYNEQIRTMVHASVENALKSKSSSLKLGNVELQDSNCIRLRFRGNFCLRAEFVALAAREDGTIIIVSDGDTPASSIWNLKRRPRPTAL
jgi:hypothetical protein